MVIDYFRILPCQGPKFTLIGWHRSHSALPIWNCGPPVEIIILTIWIPI